MEVITIQSEAFQELISSIDEIKKQITAKDKEPKEKWLDNQELMQLLHVSKRTIQKYRDEGTISFSQIGGKIYYRMSDVEELLKSNYNKAFKKK